MGTTSRTTEQRLIFLLALGTTPLLLLGLYCLVRVGFGVQATLLFVAFAVAWVAALRREARRLWLAAGVATGVYLAATLVGAFGPLKLIRLDGSGKRIDVQTTVAQLASSLVPEREPVLVALDLRMRLQPLPGEYMTVVDDMRAAYGRMPSMMNVGPTPAPATYLGLQGHDSFDVLSIEPIGEPRGTVIFLHGYGGNFAVQCHLMAEKVRRRGYRTLCPSLSVGAGWDNKLGRSVLTATREYANEDRFLVIAGLSDGAVALTETWPAADAYIVVSGASSRARCPKKPALVLHGTQDKIATAASARRLASRCEKAELVEIESGHFLLASRHHEAGEAMATFLDARR